MGSSSKTKLTSVLTAVAALLAAYVYNRYLYKAPSPVIQIGQGQLQGYEARSRSGNEYYAYLGIPFAKPPVGQLRFQSPQTPESWKGIRDATSYGSKCFQFDIMLRMTGGSEDCLFVNVFRPKINRNAPRFARSSPVMVYFYGGLFLCGDANMYSPSYFMDEPDLVLVTFNYRVGALGFLNTGDGVVRGNMGLKDQVMALKWVQANIAAFGGDPKRVTIFGESAGGASVHYHMISPLSKGLFQRAISQSGTALNHWALYDKPKEQAQRFSEGHGCGRQSSQKMVDCLRKLDAYTLVDKHREVMKPLRDWITIFNPTLESIADEHAFLTKQPVKLLREGRLSNDVPWIAGVNSHEGLMASAAIFRNASMFTRIETEFDHAASNLFETYPPNSNEIRALRQFYNLGTRQDEGDQPPVPDLDSIKFENYTSIFSDRMFNSPLHHAAKLNSGGVPGWRAPTYLYYYTYKGDMTVATFILAAKGQYPVILEMAVAFVANWVKRNVLGMKLRVFDGPCHGDELALLFPMFFRPPITPGHPQFEFSRDLVKLWTEFAKAESDEPKLRFRGVEWEPVPKTGTKAESSSNSEERPTADSRPPSWRFLRLDSVPRMIDEPFTERVQFWDKLGIDVQ